MGLIKSNWELKYHNTMNMFQSINKHTFQPQQKKYIDIVSLGNVNMLAKEEQPCHALAG